MKSVLNIHWKDWCWSKPLILWLSDTKSRLTGKDPDAGKDWRWEEKGTTEDEMAGWHHQLDAHEFGWPLGAGDGQGGLACCDSWGLKESDTTEWLNWTEPSYKLLQNLYHSLACLIMYYLVCLLNSTIRFLKQWSYEFLKGGSSIVYLFLHSGNQHLAEHSYSLI